MKEMIIATKNKGKAKEFKDFFAKKNINAISLLEVGDHLPDIEETGATFEDNAAIKAEEICRVMNKPVLADDSGLVIDALDGKPGIFSARYAGEEKDDSANIQKVLEELEGVPENERKARFVCVLALAIPNQETKYAKGYCEGEIAFSPSGKYGFGYDPIFIPEGYSVTMANLKPEEKNRISHRKNAFEKLDALMQQFI